MLLRGGVEKWIKWGLLTEYVPKSAGMQLCAAAFARLMTSAEPVDPSSY